MEHTKVAIIGSGPAGYTAAIYVARAALAPIQLAGQKAGGQLMLTTDVENFPGFKDGIPGPDLMVQMMQQAQKFGTNIKYEYATAVDFSQRPFKIWTNVPEGKTADEVVLQSKPEEYARFREQIIQAEPAITADSVILTPGAVSIMLHVPGEESLIGRGVSTCAVCDAAFYKDKNTYVIGGGDSAMEEAMALTKFAKSVTVVHRRDEFKASKIMQERVLNNPKVKVLWNTTLEEVIGSDKLTALKLNTNGQVQEVPADGVFIAIGHRPVTSIFAGQVQLDDHGYFVTRQSTSREGVAMAQSALDDLGRVTFPSMTSIPGVFAAGDCVDRRYRQAITSAGQGCCASIDAERWLEDQENGQ